MQARLRVVIGLAVLGLLVLGACGGDSEPLTTRDYAHALEEAHAVLQEKLMEELEAYSDSLRDLVERLDSLDSPRSDEDAKSARELVEKFSQLLASTTEGIIKMYEDYYDDVSRLRPPEHLSYLHKAMTARLEEFLDAGHQLVDDLKDTDKDITDENIDRVSTLSGQVDEPCQEMRAKLEAELGTDVAICD